MRWFGKAGAHAALLVLLAASCSDPKDDRPDGGGGGDAGVAQDAGIRAFCPVDSNPQCQAAGDCQSSNAPPTNCGYCKSYNRSVCLVGRCETPEQLSSGDPHNYLFQVGSLQPELMSFAGIVLDRETAGGQYLTCADFYASTVDIDSGCLNILDSRGSPAIAQMGDTYLLTFTRFASGVVLENQEPVRTEREALFVVYGFAMEEAQGVPIGISCAEFTVGAPGQGLVPVPGDMMRRIP